MEEKNIENYVINKNQELVPISDSNLTASNKNQTLIGEDLAINATKS